MQSEVETIDILKDVSYAPDVKGPALLVSWRHIPMGFIRPLTRLPTLRRDASKEARRLVREQHKEHLGKWTASPIGGGYFDTKEEAARHLVLSVLRTDAATSPLFQAALRGDYEEVERLMRRVRDHVVVHPTICALVLDNSALGLNDVAQGKWVAREEGVISRIAKRKKLRQLFDYVSATTEDAAALTETFGENLQFPEPAWFDPDEGLAWAARIADHVERNPGAVGNPDGVLADLRQYEAALREARSNGARWHFEMRP